MLQQSYLLSPIVRPMTEPLTMNYDQIVAYVEEMTASEQAIKDIERESNSFHNTQKGDEIGQLVNRLHLGCEVPKKK
jgi:predicted transcriptional regulator